MIQEIDAEYLDGLTRRTELDLRIVTATAESLPEPIRSHFSDAPAFSEALVVPDGPVIWSGLLLPDGAGGEPIAVIARTPRELTANARTALQTSLAVVIVLGVAGFFSGLAFLDKRILSRLAALSARVIRDAPDVKVSVPQGSSDEIDQLSNLMDAAFRSIPDNERFLAEILSAIKVGVMLVRKRDRVIVSVNRYASELIGLAEGDIVGKACHHFVCTADVGKCPVIDLAQPCDNSRRQIIGRDGQRIDILKSATTVNRDGEEYLLETFLDIREMERTRRLLQESEERYRAIFMNTGNPGCSSTRTRPSPSPTGSSSTWSRSRRRTWSAIPPGHVSSPGRMPGACSNTTNCAAGPRTRCRAPTRPASWMPKAGGTSCV
jgi:PAS domain-containing protein